MLCLICPTTSSDTRGLIILLRISYELLNNRFQQNTDATINGRFNGRILRIHGMKIPLPNCRRLRTKPYSEHARDLGNVAYFVTTVVNVYGGLHELKLGLFCYKITTKTISVSNLNKYIY